MTQLGKFTLIIAIIVVLAGLIVALFWGLKGPFPKIVTCCTGSNCTRVDKAQCDAAGGTVNSASSCSPNPCPQGQGTGISAPTGEQQAFPDLITCCVGSVCSKATQTNCDVAGGRVVNAAYCSPNPCGTGGTGSAANLPKPAELPMTAETPSPTATIVTCCVGSTCTRVGQAQCDAAGGTVDSASSCYPNPCSATAPSGATEESFPKLVACCVGTVCSKVTEANCASAGGTVASASYCSPNPCVAAVSEQFKGEYETGTMENDLFYVNLMVTPQELADNEIKTMEVDLGGQSIPHPFSTSVNLNQMGWDVSDWTGYETETTGVWRFSGSTPMIKSYKTIITLYFTVPIPIIGSIDVILINQNGRHIRVVLQP